MASAGRTPERWRQLTFGLDRLIQPIAVIGNWRTGCGVVLHVNPAWIGMTGFTAAEALGQPAPETIFGPNGSEIRFDSIRSAIARDGAYREVVARRRKVGPPVSVRVRAWTVRLARNGEDYLIASLAPAKPTPENRAEAAASCNILSFGRRNGGQGSENQRLASALVNAQLRFQRSLDACPFGVERIDPAGRILYANPIYHDFLGYAENELNGENVFERLLEARQAPALKSYLAHILATQPRPTPIYANYRRKDGEAIALRLDWSFDRGDGGTITGLLSIVTPASDQADEEEPRADAPPRPAGETSASATSAPRGDGPSGNDRLLKDTLHAARVWASILANRHPDGDDARIVDKVDQAIDDALRLLGAERRPLAAASSYYEDTTPLHGLVVGVVEPVDILRTSIADLISSWGCHPVGVEAPTDTVPALIRSGRLPDIVIMDMAAAIGLDGDSIVQALWRRYGPGTPVALVADDVAPETEKFAESVGMKVIRRPLHPIELRSALLSLWRHTRRGRQK